MERLNAVENGSVVQNTTTAKLPTQEIGVESSARATLCCREERETFI